MRSQRFKDCSSSCKSSSSSSSWTATSCHTSYVLLIEFFMRKELSWGKNNLSSSCSSSSPFPPTDDRFLWWFLWLDFPGVCLMIFSFSCHCIKDPVSLASVSFFRTRWCYDSFSSFLSNSLCLSSVAENVISVTAFSPSFFLYFMGVSCCWCLRYTLFGIWRWCPDDDCKSMERKMMMITHISLRWKGISCKKKKKKIPRNVFTARDTWRARLLYGMFQLPESASEKE